MENNRSKRTQYQILSILNENEGSQTEFDSDNSPEYASKYGFECAYPALKTYSVRGLELENPSFYIHVGRNGLWGLCDIEGKEVLPCIYEDIDFVIGCMAYYIVLYKFNGKWGGYWIYPTLEDLSPQFDNLWWDTERFPHRICGKLNGMEGLIDFNQKVRVPFEYQSLRPLSKDDHYFDEYPLLIAKKNNKCGIIDCNNSLVVPIEYDEIYSKDKKLYGRINEVAQLLEF